MVKVSNPFLLEENRGSDIEEGDDGDNGIYRQCENQGDRCDNDVEDPFDVSSVKRVCRYSCSLHLIDVRQPILGESQPDKANLLSAQVLLIRTHETSRLC